MKTDNQHLDFLVSQYVDGGLEAPARKLLEQKLAGDVQASALLKEHREVQDLLDDWGSRIPMIDWNQFDQQLAARLAAESAAPQHKHAWRAWLRPMAAAAALVFAACVGYSWHAWSLPINSGTGGAVAVKVAPDAPVSTAQISEPAGAGTDGRASLTRVAIDERPSDGGARVSPVVAAEHVHMENTLAANSEHQPQPTPQMATTGSPRTIPGSARAEAPIIQPTTDTLH